MRIGINGRFYRAPVTGVQRFAREVANGIAGRADTVLLLPRDVRDDDVALPSQVPTIRGRLRGHAWEQIELPRMARRAACDIVLHLSGTIPLHGGPHVAVMHDVLPLTHPHLFSPLFAAWYGLLLRRTAPRSAAILTVSEQSRTAIARVLSPRRIEVVPQGLAPFDTPAPDSLVDRVTAAFGLPPTFLLALGLGDRRKNLGFLPSVLDAYRERHGAPPVVIAIGNTVTRVHGRADWPVHPEIWPVGRVTDEELHALYSGASALLFPSIAEGFGRPPLEAAACGTPSLIAEEAELPEPARRAGLPVPLQAAAWADTIALLLADSERHAGLVACGREACDGLRWDVTVDRVLEICMDVVRAGRIRSGRPHEEGAR